MANDPITLPETRTPSYFNQYLVTGLKVGTLPVLGAIAAMAVAGIAAPTGVLLYALYALGGASVIGGAAAGAYYGRERIQENLAKGGERAIPAPYLFNEGMAQGALNGLMLTLGAVAAVATFGIPALGLTTVAQGVTALSTGGIALISAVAGAGLMGTTALSYIQGNDHYQQMARDYEVAKQLDAQRGSGIGLDALMSQVSAAKEKQAPQPDRVTEADMARIDELLAARAAEKAAAGRVNPDMGRGKGAA